MKKLVQMLVSMNKIGLIGFGGGNALIPVIQQEVVEEKADAVISASVSARFG